jgi:hypothetical protein
MRDESRIGALFDSGGGRPQGANTPQTSIAKASGDNLHGFAAKVGGAERNRTAGLLIANEALSQLSYSPGSFKAENRPARARI